MTETKTTGFVEGSLDNIPEEMRRRPPYAVQSGIAAIKQATPVEIYASTLTDLRPSGESLRGRCPIHKGSNAEAFAVYPSEGRWYCFRCSTGGDVVDLCQRVEEHDELWSAMVSLAVRYGVELPRRSEGWHERQPEKHAVREAAIRHVAKAIQRRLTRIYRPLVLFGDETPGEELQQLEELAAALGPVARQWAQRRVQDA